MVSLREPFPSVFVDGKSVFRAITSEVALEADPPGWLIPPMKSPLRPKFRARWRDVNFSISVRAGET
jgi:hypothetical protein